MKKLIILGVLVVAGVVQAGQLGSLTRNDYVTSTNELQNVKFYGATGDGVTDDTVEIQAALDVVGTAGGGLVYVPDGTYVISAPLIIYDDTTLECSAGATISFAVGSDTNMIQNEFAISFAGRNTNIVIRGGTWDRGNNNGTGGGRNIIHLRSVDNVHVRDTRILSINGKFCIAFGDVNNFYAENITVDCSSDVVHITGPATNGWISHIRGIAGDDVVGITTTDYVENQDTVGSIHNINIQDLNVATPFRSVLIMGAAGGVPDGFSVTSINVSDVTHSSASSSYAVLMRGVGDGTTELMDHITLSRIRGGLIGFSHPNMGQVILDDIACPTSYGGILRFEIMEDAPDGTNTIVSVQDLQVRNTDYAERLIITTITNLYVGTFMVDNSSFEGLKILSVADSVQIDNMRLKNCSITHDTERVIQFYGTTIGELSIIDSYMKPHLGGFCISPEYNTVIERLTLQGSVFEANGASSVIAEVRAETVIAKTHIDNCVFDGGLYLFHRTLAGTGGRAMFMSNSTVTNMDYILYHNGTDVEFSYSNIDVSTDFDALWATTGGSLLVKGSGWKNSGITDVVRGGTSTLRVMSWDLEVDPDRLTPLAGDYIWNNNAGVGGGVGPSIYDGTVWTRLY